MHTLSTTVGNVFLPYWISLISRCAVVLYRLELKHFIARDFNGYMLKQVISFPCFESHNLNNDTL